MRAILLIFFPFFFFSNSFGHPEKLLHPHIEKLESLMGPFQTSAKNLLVRLLEGQHMAMVKSKSEEDNQQSMVVYALGAHPKNCIQSVERINRYESYSSFLDFVQRSTYDAKKNFWSLTFVSPILPASFILNFNFPRLQGEGRYPFSFPEGIFKGLQGEIELIDARLDERDPHPRCLYQVSASWKGKSTKIPSPIIEVFVQTLAELSMQKLFKL